MPNAKGVDLDDIAINALTAMILEHVALTLTIPPGTAPTALEQLAAKSGLALEICAATMLACSALMGAGNLNADDAGALAAVYESLAQDAATKGEPT